MKLCRRLHVASSTRLTYAVSQGIFISFCETFGHDPLAITEEGLCSAAVHYAMQHSVRSVRSYMSAVQHLWTEHGVGPLPRGPAYLLTTRGLTRLLGAADVVVRSRSISAAELKRMVDQLDATDPEDCCFALQIIVAFFLCLRTEDHTCGRLRWGDVYPQADGSVEFLLPPGKSVKFFRHVACAARTDSLDVGLWLRRVARHVPVAHRRPASPMFVSFPHSRTRLGARLYWAVSTRTFISRFKHAVKSLLGYDPALYAGYSLRRGGVTELISRNCPMPAIKRHVGWAAGSTAIYDYYDHHGKAQLLGPSLLI